MIVKRVGPLSMARLCGILYGGLGLIFGAFLSLIAMVSGLSNTGSGGFGAIMGAGAVIAFPILYGVLGFVATLIAAWLYNVAAGMVGGVEIDVQ